MRTSSLQRFALFAAAGVVLLTLFIKAQAFQDTRHHQQLVLLDQFAQLNMTAIRDVLWIHSGHLKHYDGPKSALRRMGELEAQFSERVHEAVPSDPALDESLLALRRALALRERHIDHFVSASALLQNSGRYLSKVAEAATTSERSHMSDAQLRFLHDVLLFNQTGNPQIAAKIARQLPAMQRTNDGHAAVAAHAALILQQHREGNHYLQLVLDGSVARQLQVVRARYDDIAQRARREARAYELGLLACALAILAIALGAFIQLGRRTRELNEANATLERRVRERTAELEEANAILVTTGQALEQASQAKSMFLANMSHELRTPLNAVIGYSELLQEEARDTGCVDFVPDLQKIHTAGKHLLGLINDILDLAKIEAGKMGVFVEAFDLGDLVDEVHTTVQPLVAGGGNTLEVRLQPGLPAMRTDTMKVRQCLTNLLTNAAKFTHDGHITLEVASELVDGLPWVTLSVADTGIGMTAEQLGRIFQEFAQADASTTRKYGGTGLGLSITTRLLQLLGGDIAVASELGKGATFTIRLPARYHPPNESPDATAESASRRIGEAKGADAPAIEAEST